MPWEGYKVLCCRLTRAEKSAFLDILYNRFPTMLKAHVACSMLRRFIHYFESNYDRIVAELVACPLDSIPREEATTLTLRVTQYEYDRLMLYIERLKPLMIFCSVSSLLRRFILLSTADRLFNEL